MTAERPASSTTKPKRSSGGRLALRIAKRAVAKKAEDVLLLDLRGLSSEVDHFVIMSALSEPHQKALADTILEDLQKAGHKHWQIAGYPSSGWILIDYVDVVVHIFRPETRAFYSLETLWGDARAKHVKDDAES